VTDPHPRSCVICSLGSNLHRAAAGERSRPDPDAGGECFDIIAIECAGLDQGERPFDRRSGALLPLPARKKRTLRTSGLRPNGPDAASQDDDCARNQISLY